MNRHSPVKYHRVFCSTSLKQLLLIALSLGVRVLHGQVCAPATAHCFPGAILTVNASPLVAPDTIVLSPASGTGVSYNAPAIVGTGPTFSFIIPPETTDGTYTIKAKHTGPPPADLTDLAPSQVIVQHPSITAVSPAQAFRGDKQLTKVTVIGNGFNQWQNQTPTPEAQHLLHIRFLELHTPTACDAGGTPTNCVTVTLVSDHEVQLNFHDLDHADEFYGKPIQFVMDVGSVSTAPANLKLIDTMANTPMYWAGGFFCAILAVVFFLLMRGKKSLAQKISDKNYFLSALFLDLPTNTYSLSKCQFYAWTAASVLGYLYLAFSENVVQGSIIFPDIPSGLPGILLASAATAVISAGISSAKGDKGAGSPGPNLSDFISSGGVVAADRLQFVIWTIVGIGTFLSIVILSDPRSISDLPRIPPGFLQLMGISSAGYIAGKLTRKAGPTIDNITVSGTPALMTFQVTGSGLSRSALFSIDQAPIYPDTIVNKSGQPGLPEIIQADPTMNDPDYARILSVTFSQPSLEWLGGPHNLAITNPDAQRAVWPFQIFQVDTITINSATGALVITGVCLNSNLAVTYAVGAGAATSAARSNDVKNATQYLATLTGVVAGPVTVTVADSSGMSVVKNVTAT